MVPGDRKQARVRVRVRVGARIRGRVGVGLVLGLGVGLRTELKSGVRLRGSNIKSTVMFLLGLGLR